MFEYASGIASRPRSVLFQVRVRYRLASAFSIVSSPRPVSLGIRVQYCFESAFGIVSRPCHSCTTTTRDWNKNSEVVTCNFFIESVITKVFLVNLIFCRTIWRKVSRNSRDHHLHTDSSKIVNLGTSLPRDAIRMMETTDQSTTDHFCSRVAAISRKTQVRISQISEIAIWASYQSVNYDISLNAVKDQK
jgi:hypothetical protein